MRIVMFYHTLLSDWNHGNAHFLRGIVAELLDRGHTVELYEPAWAWSLEQLIGEHGTGPVAEFRSRYPNLKSIRYYGTPNGWVRKALLKHAWGKLTHHPLSSLPLVRLDLDKVLKDADLVLVHEWSEHWLVEAVGEHKKRAGGYPLLFHDTHHRSVTKPIEMAGYKLEAYDGALCFGKVIRDLYVAYAWAKRAWTWHEAADTRVFHPIPDQPREGDLVWVGNWGDDERTKELHEFLLRPVKELKLKARVHGVRYPDDAKKALKDAGIEYAGWLPNYKAPEVFARYGVTVHVPRRPYVQKLPGIPTIRVFEALACGIPLVCSPWDDAEGLFTPGEDFLMAQNGEEMKRHLQTILTDETFAGQLAERGLQTIKDRHTCAHRVDELMNIVEDLRAGRAGKVVSAA